MTKRGETQSNHLQRTSIGIVGGSWCCFASIGLVGKNQQYLYAEPDPKQPALYAAGHGKAISTETELLAPTTTSMLRHLAHTTGSSKYGGQAIASHVYSK